MAMFLSTYSPIFAYPILADMLDGLMRGHTNVTTLLVDDIPTGSDIKDEDSCADANAGAGAALNCGEAEDVYGADFNDFMEYLSALEKQSSIGT